ncbi:MAG: C40 family peptidase [Gemmatimonadota bacterium]|nr:C40 family peptidase [Gemmatimonadota bacterium]
MKRRTLLFAVALIPGALSAQSSTSVTTFVLAGAPSPGAPMLVGASLATESGLFGGRMVGAIDVREPAPGGSSAWGVDLDGTAALGTLIPSLADWRLFAGVGARRSGGDVVPGPVSISTSLGGGYRYGLGRFVAVEGDMRYRIPFAEHESPGIEVSAGIVLRTGTARRSAARQPSLVSRPADPAAATAAPSVSASALALRAIDSGSEFVGVRYTWGGNSPEEGFDCSGFLRYVFLRHGIALPRVSRDQARFGEALPAQLWALRPGDLMFFATQGGEVDHAGMYVGDGKMLHSSSSGGGVRFDDLTSARGEYYVRHLVAARRVVSSSVMDFAAEGG